MRRADTIAIWVCWCVAFAGFAATAVAFVHEPARAQEINPWIGLGHYVEYRTFGVGSRVCVVVRNVGYTDSIAAPLAVSCS